MSPLRNGIENARVQYYPRFSEEVFKRRRRRVREHMRSEDLDVLLVYGNDGFFQSKIQYLTNYRPPFPTYLAFFADPEKNSTLFIGLSNHVQEVREISVIDDLRLLLPDTPQTIISRLRETGFGSGRVGIVGQDPRYNLSIPHQHYERIASETDVSLIDVTAEYTKLISVADEEELELVEKASDILDEAMDAFEDGLKPGVTELDLKHILMDTCQQYGASLGTDYITASAMEDAEPGEPLPWHRASERTVESGDVITTELTVDYRGYSAQIHRSFALETSPNETYSEMHTLLEEVYHQIVTALQPGNTAEDVYEAMEVVESSEYKIYDVMLHGHGGGYRHPFVGVEESNYWPGADDRLTEEWHFEPGMVVVVQPNVVTRDERAGIQLGSSVIIREDGPDVLQQFPVEFRQVDG